MGSLSPEQMNMLQKNDIIIRLAYHGTFSYTESEFCLRTHETPWKTKANILKYLFEYKTEYQIFEGTPTLHLQDQASIETISSHFLAIIQPTLTLLSSPTTGILLLICPQLTTNSASSLLPFLDVPRPIFSFVYSWLLSAAFHLRLTAGALANAAECQLPIFGCGPHSNNSCNYC